MELGLASRSDLLQILNHTVHGGKSVHGMTDGEQTKRLDKSMFASSTLGSTSSSEDSLLSPASSGGGISGANSTDSPVGPSMFQLDSPAASGLHLSQSARFPVSLERAPSAESLDFALASCNQEPSVAGGNVFQMTDTAHDDAERGEDSSMYGVRQAQPPPLSPAAAEEQQQRSPEQLLLQQQQLQQQLPQQVPAQQAPAQHGTAHRRKLYAYGIADPEYMSLPCKMSMKHARVTVNHETNSRLYGKKLPSQVRHASWWPKTLRCPCFPMLT